ncbi:nitrate reductase molybdenum cofactor assembly chaperone [Spongiactinospora sp. TRM90649]|uniref:nitrate reductase molybdenum cofactor assembly chaperone n=1 Tax=Spongiactinospora sp. TRM90649 TaxID=3031114 RepID=UPI0023F7DFC7|nr:nitrate reductase molybdenum cofactor assembly chaperone [Spongiactinospora sp. TRM90649]MDF5751363.1 nitrate reductase molybdenum cofactor assembly chaperone [Spongiactinospora sp. TRM90649]
MSPRRTGRLSGRLSGLMPERRERLPEDGVAVVRQAVGFCLDYPAYDLFDRLPLIQAAMSEYAGHPPASAVTEFAEWLGGTEPMRAEEHYVSVFDTRNRRSLHLTWWSDGDTRRRGFSLAAIKARYRAHGLTPPGGDELPDFLPVMLEYAALEPQDGTALLQEHRAGLELLRFALVEADTPYALLLGAVCDTLPGPSPKNAAEARRMAPPPPGLEMVGLGGGPGRFAFEQPRVPEVADDSVGH